MSGDEELEDRLAEISDMPHGDAQVQRAEELVRQCDRLGQEDGAFEARLMLVQAAVFGGYPQKALVAFSWCASKCDEDPQRFKESRSILGMFLGGVDLLWAYKWMTLQIPWYDTIDRAQIERLLTDMEARYQRHGLSMRPVHMQRTRAVLEMGDPVDQAVAHYQKWVRADRDLYADCEACEASFRVEYHLDRGEDADAVRLARPLIDGDLDCAEIPHITFGALLMPLLRLGQDALAARLHRRGYELVRGNREFVRSVSQHMAYRARTGDLDGGCQMLGEHIAWAWQNPVLDRAFHFFLASAFLMRALAGDGRSTVDLSLPATMPVHRAEGRYDPAELVAFFEARAREIAARFDARNGTDLYARRVADYPELPAR